MMKRFAACAVVLWFVAFASLGQAGPLLNPGFETGDFTGWTLTGTAESGVDVDGTPITGVFEPATTVVNVHSGEYAAWAKVSRLNTFELVQTVDVLPNTDYDIGIWGCWGGETHGSAGMISTIFVDDVEIFSSSDWLLGGTGPEEYSHLSTVWASGPSTSAEVKFHFTRTAPTETPGGFSFDDAHVDRVRVIPEPASIGLLALGGLGFLRRRRRR